MSCIYVVGQFYPWFKFSSLLFLGMVMQDNEFETKDNKIKTNNKIEQQHLQRTCNFTIYIFLFGLKICYAQIGRCLCTKYIWVIDSLVYGAME